MMFSLLGNVCVTLTPKVKVQTMYFLVNALSPKPFDVETSNFAGAYVK